MKGKVESQRFIEAGSRFSDAIVVTDADGLIQWTNHAFHMLCGFTKHEALGRRPGDFLQGKNTDPATVRALHEAIEKGRYINAEILNYHKKGHPYWVSISITPIRDEEGELTGFISIERDITEQRLRTAELEKQIVEVYSALLCSEKGELSEKPSGDPFLSKVKQPPQTQ